jgi:hypothetical protein
MGLEAVCTVSSGSTRAEAKVLLETDFIAARGALRLQIPFREISSVSANDGILEVVHTGGTARFELGQDSEKWAAKILNPKKLIDKLGVKSDSKVSVLRLSDPVFRAELSERTSNIHDGKAAAASDFIFIMLRTPSDFDQLPRLRAKLAPAGAIWAVWTKGKGQQVSENDVIAAAKTAGLVDVKVARFSDTLSALKLVIPRAARK